MFRYQIGFDDESGMMGCATLGYCAREGRDRTEEERFYADFLRREGYVVVAVKDGFARVESDAGGIVRNPVKKDV